MGAAETACDVVVVGAGAAGLMAAICAARSGRRTVLLEKNERPGLKILISGGGRCNLTTTRSGADLEAQYGAVRGRFLRHALRSFPPAALRTFIEAAGVPLQEEDLEKLFPVSQKARDVVEALLRLARAAGVQVMAGAPVRALGRAGAGFVAETPRGALRAASVVLATGGLSYPKTGTTGDGYGFCRSFGHTITPLHPALAPLAVAAAWPRALQGIVVHGADLSSIAGDGRELCRRRRPILFTHKGLSGPAPMDLAGDIEEQRGAGCVRFDFAPEVPREVLEAAWLAAAAAHGTRRVETLLPAHLPERLRLALVAEAAAEGTLAGLARDARRRLLTATKDLRLPVPHSLGYDHAEVTRGGVALAEIDARTMQSRLQPGLFVCGELLDVDGPIGGFNFQAAFATGRLAGLHA
ncbi:MAG TPA: aminoacetone oxidase family FAD-binding enzyme [Planctomycetota bacterium]|nr:aminoacetone oxidase family FAD-binding enzyme [Planctomycetota bacterium]